MELLAARILFFITSLSALNNGAEVPESQRSIVKEHRDSLNISTYHHAATGETRSAAITKDTYRHGSVTKMRIREQDAYILRGAGTPSQLVSGEYSSTDIDSPKKYQGLDRRKRYSLGTLSSRLIITQHFTERTVTPGGDITMQCSASADRPPQFVWERDGVVLSSNTDPRYALGQLMTSDNSVDSHLNITRVRVEDGGLYTCVAKEGDAVVSHENRLDVYGPPYIRSLPPIKVQSGESINLRCPYYGYPISKIDWEHQGKIITSHNYPRYGEAPIVNLNGVLSISEVNKDLNGAVFTCVVTSPSVEMARRSFEIQVIEAPVLEELLLGNNLQEGQIVNIYCNVRSGDLPIHFEWLKDGKRIPSILKVAERNSELFSALVIKKVSLEHCGTYTCVASNHVAKVNRSTELYIKVSPRWSTAPRNSSLLAGRAGSVPCAAAGHPPPRAHWMRRDGVMGTWQPVPELSAGAVGPRAASDGTLHVDAATAADEGLYSCNVENGVGQPLTMTIWISVNKPAHFASPSSNVTARLGHGTSARCDALGDQPLKLTWTKNGRSVERSSRIKITDTTSPEGVQSELSFQYTEASDAGLYQCRANNPYGAASFDVMLTVLEPPAPPIDVRVDSVTSTAATVSWRDTLPSHVQYYTVSLGTNSERATLLNFNVTRQNSDIRQSTELQNLHPATSYSVKVAAGNQVDVSPYTVGVHFTTLEEAPSLPPSAVSVQQATSPGALRTRWGAPPKAALRGTLLGYRVKAVPQGRDEDAVIKTVKVSQVSMQEELLLSDLKKNTRYAVSIAAFNNAGTGPYSIPIFQDTREGAPELPPSSVECSGAGARALRAAWRGVERGVTSYILLYAADDEPWQNLSSPHPEVYLQALRKFTNYTLKVAAVSDFGVGPYSYPIVCTTLEDVPGPPADIKVLVSSPSALLVSWKPPEEPNGILVYYTIYVKVAGSGSPQSYRVEASRAEVPRGEVPSTHHLHHEIWVTAATAAGPGPPSPRRTITPTNKVVAGIWSLGGRVRAGAGGSMLLACASVGSPPPRAVWYHHHNIITHHPRFTRNHDDSLLINNIDQSLAGNYTCLVKNLYGSDSVVYRVEVVPAPEPPALRATPSHRDIRVEWTDEGGGRGHGQMITYSLTWKESNGPWQQVRPIQDATSYTISDLKCGTKYSLRITAANKIGTSRPAYLDVATLGGPPIPPTTPDWITTNSSHIRVTRAGWDDNGCPIREWEVQYRPYGSTQWIAVSTDLSRSSVWWGGAVATLGALRAGAWHQVRVAALSDAGRSIAIETVHTTTENGDPVPPPSELMELNVAVIACSCVLLAGCLTATLCILLRRRRTGNLTNYHNTMTLDNKSSSGNLTATTSHSAPAAAAAAGKDSRIYSAPEHQLRASGKHELYEISPYAQFAVGFRTFGHVDNQDLPGRHPRHNKYDSETSFQACSESEDSDSISKSTLKSMPRKVCRTPHHR